MAREVVVYPASGSPGMVLTNRAAGYRVLKGARGLGAPELEHAVDETPLLDGGVVTDVWAPPRTIVLPLLVLAADEAGYRQRVRALLAALSPGREVQLEIGQPDGQRRRIRARYERGLEGEESADTGGETWHRVALSFFCEDPFWFDPVPVSVSFEYGGGPAAFFPILPIRLAASSVLGSVTIDNPGDVLAWPAWTITGPGADVQLDHLDYDESLHLTGSLPVSEVLFIDTSPTSADIVLSDGTDWWDRITGIPTLWPLRTGLNRVSLNLSGAASGSRIYGAFSPRYWSAW